MNTVADILCPVCPSDDLCEHDQDERRTLCRLQNVEPTPVPETYNASDQSQIAKKAARQRRRQSQADNDLRTVLDTQPGRRFIWALLERCGIFRTTYAPGNPDALAMAFAEGARNVGLELLAELARVAPEKHVQMMKERSDAA